MTDTKKKMISFIVPVFNEEDNIPLCYAAMKQFADAQPKYDFEFLFTNNHSQDLSLEILKTLRQGDQRVKYLSYSKNFGHQRSILQGILHAQGDAAVMLDCDLQDPLDVVHTFIEKWEAGHDVVYGIRISRSEGKITTFCRNLSYHIINKISEDEIPINAGDFRLIDRKIINELHKISEDKPYLRVIIASLGFEQTGVPYKRLSRKYGTTKFPLKDMIRFILDGVFSRSSLPLRLATYTGLFITCMAVIGFIVYFTAYFLGGNASWPKGYASIILLIIFAIGLNALFLGIIGEYINRIHTLLRKNDPNAIIQESAGVQVDEASTLN